jgi:hypothetical protein
VFVQLQGASGSGSGKRLLVGVTTALVFHHGRGKARTNWFMHEYRLAALPGAGAADQKKYQGLAEFRMDRLQGLTEEHSEEESTRKGLQ